MRDAISTPNNSSAASAQGDRLSQALLVCVWVAMTLGKASWKYQPGFKIHNPGWVLEQTKSDTRLEAKITPLKPSYFGHLRRQGSLEKQKCQEKPEVAGKAGTKPELG